MENFNNPNPDDLINKINAHDMKALDQNNISQEMRIQIYSGLLATTPIIIDDEISDIYKLFLAHIEGYTLGLDTNTGRVVNTHMLSVPEEIKIDRFDTLEFSCGLKLQCTPTTKILAVNKDGKNEFLSVENLEEGQSIVGFGIRPDIGIGERTFKLVKKTEEYNILGVPAYFFVCEHQTIFIPHEGGLEGDVMSFIVLHQ